MKPLHEMLELFAKIVDSTHGNDSDWWKGYVKGLKRAASLVEVYEAFAEDGDESGS